MKSIYNQDDLRLSPDGLEASFDGKEFFKAMLEKYPEHNPRELVELFASEFSLMAARRILELRRSGVLKVE